MESTKNLLPLSDDVKQSQETEHKVPTMTRQGVYAALSYMASSGLFQTSFFLFIYNAHFYYTSYNFLFISLDYFY